MIEWAPVIMVSLLVGRASVAGRAWLRLPRSAPRSRTVRARPRAAVLVHDRGEDEHVADQTDQIHVVDALARRLRDGQDEPVRRHGEEGDGEQEVEAIPARAPVLQE